MDYMSVQDQIAPFYWVRLASGVAVFIGALLYLYAVLGPVRAAAKAPMGGAAQPAE